MAPKATISGVEKEASEAKPPVFLHESSWLRQMAKNEDVLGSFAATSPLWSSVLQNKYVEALRAYDELSNPDESSRVACARSAVELAETAEVLEELLSALIVRTLEIQKSRPDADKVSVWRRYFSGARLQTDAGALGVWADADKTFLNPATQTRVLPEPAMESLRTRWRLLDRLRDGVQGKALSVKRFMAQSRRLSGPDLSVAIGEQTFDFIEPKGAELTRRYFARRALDCLEGLGSTTDVLRLKALRLEGRLKEAVEVYRLHKAPAEIPLDVQILTLQTSVDAFEQALFEEYVRVSEIQKQSWKDSASMSRPSLAGWLIKDRNQSRTGNKKVDRAALSEIDPVDLNRSLLKFFEENGEIASGTVTTLTSRLVDAILRGAADAHYLRGDYPKAAQIRRRIGGTSSFEIGPKVPPSALAASALDHWKIVEPRSAIRYLKDLGKVFPNAKRSADLLRDILSYRARQKGGATAAGQ